MLIRRRVLLQQQDLRTFKYKIDLFNCCENEDDSIRAFISNKTTAYIHVY